MKKLLGVLLVITMILCACSNSAQTTETKGNSETKAETVAPVETTKETVEETEVAAGVPWEDMEEITMIYPILGSVPSGLADVEAAINEITEAEINTHVNYMMVEMGNYPQQISLMMSSGEALDVMMMGFGSCSFGSMQAQGQLMDMKPYLEKYAQDTLDILGRFVEGTTIDGGIYGLTGYRDQLTSVFVVMRKDVLEDLGLLKKAENMKSLAEFEEIMIAVQNSEKWNYLVPLAGTSDGNILFHANLFDVNAEFMTASCYDHLGDNMKLVSATPDGKVYLTPELDEYRAIYDLLSDWYAKGYIHKDATTTAEMGHAFINADAAFAYVSSDSTSVQSTQNKNCGREVVCVKMIDFLITTASCRGFGVCMPTTCQAPEATAAFINMMYTDSRIANLLSWGIEGVDYEVVNGEACYIAGNETPAYHANDFFFSNQFITLPWQGAGATVREDTKVLMDAAPFSDFMGFSCDTSEITEEIAAVTNVREEYRKIIETGMATEEQYQEYVDKLYACGADKIVECYQKQLDAFLAGK